LTYTVSSSSSVCRWWIWAFVIDYRIVGCHVYTGRAS
jgi:hypothetical protein